MTITSSIVRVFVMGAALSVIACAPPTPKVQQPAAAPQRIERTAGDPVRYRDTAFRSTVRWRSLPAPTRYG